MKFIPEARSLKWVRVFIAYTVIIYAALFASQYILKSQLTAQNISGLGILAVVSALIACAGGWLGARLFFLCCAAGSITGALYMLIIAITDSAPGWSDLVTLAGFFVLSVIGIGVGLVADLVWFIIKSRREK